MKKHIHYVGLTWLYQEEEIHRKRNMNSEETWKYSALLVTTEIEIWISMRYQFFTSLFPKNTEAGQEQVIEKMLS